MKSTVSNLRRYLKELSAIPLLTKDEEKHIAVRAKAGDTEALRKLIESNLRFVIKISCKYQKSGISILEIINEGNIGLIEAARRFDPERGVRFTSYAVWWIQQRIFKHIAESSGIFCLSQKNAQIRYRIGQALSKRTNLENRMPTNQELSQETGVSLRQVKLALEISAKVYSLDVPLTEESETILSDELAQKVVPSPENSAIAKSLKEQIEEKLQLLSSIEQRVLRLRFGLDDDIPLTLMMVGKHLNLSRERIHQLERQALSKLRQSSASLALYLN
jgi:RNA polymerase primary sigma factor